MPRLPTGKMAVLTVMLASSGSAALAGSASAPPSPDWTVTIGVESRVMPAYEGSGDSVLRPVPYFGLRRTGTPAQFRGPRDGAGIALFDSGQFRVGPSFKVRLPRKEGDNRDLRGLGDVDWTLEAGAFAEFWPTDRLRTRVELRQGIGGHDGLVSDVTADMVVPVAPRLTLSGGPRLTLASTAATSPYFSVTPAQAAASGLPVYDAGGGLRSYGVGAQARYEWSPRWASHIFIEYERLAGDAAAAPLVTQRGTLNQIQLGIGLTYSFDVPGLW